MRYQQRPPLSQHPTLLAEPWGHVVVAFWQVFTPALQRWLWRNGGQLGEVEMSRDYRCTNASCHSQMRPFFPPNMGFLWCWGLSLAPRDVHGHDVHDPAPILGAGMGWHIASHCGAAWP